MTDSEQKNPEAKASVVREGVSTARRANIQVPIANVYIQATYNNILVSLTKPNGDVLVWSTSGACGFRGPKKATPYAAQTVVRTVAERARPFGVREVNIFLRGVGGGREAAVRTLHGQGFNVLSIKDVTPVPHNGCRRPRERRV